LLKTISFPENRALLARRAGFAASAGKMQAKYSQRFITTIYTLPIKPDSTKMLVVRYASRIPERCSVAAATVLPDRDWKFFFQSITFPQNPCFCGMLS
jgi:hypothetical protein